MESGPKRHPVPHFSWIPTHRHPATLPRRRPPPIFGLCTDTAPPTRPPLEFHAMHLATRLAPLTLDADSGESTALGDFWRDAPVVLVFIRHFG